VTGPQPARRKARCPICGRPPTAASRQFCSQRCRDEDLRRWLGGVYRIPGERQGEADDGAEET
jgi:endogenous inhibitor of DNA gyrase (YacG/DUF329 family)